MNIRDIQQRLAELGLYAAKVDGILGPLTLNAMASAIGVKADDAPAPETGGDPPWLILAQKEVGVREGAGGANNPRVLGYYAEAQHQDVRQDSVPWCAAFVGAMLARAGIAPSGSLMARSYLNWGAKLEKPKRGCVVVFKRGAPPSGHVAFYVGPGMKALGGNQSDAVTIAGYRADSVLGYRWPLQ